MGEAVHLVPEMPPNQSCLDRDDSDFDFLFAA